MPIALIRLDVGEKNCQSGFCDCVRWTLVTFRHDNLQKTSRDRREVPFFAENETCLSLRLGLKIKENRWTFIFSDNKSGFYENK